MIKATEGEQEKCKSLILPQLPTILISKTSRVVCGSSVDSTPSSFSGLWMPINSSLALIQLCCLEILTLLEIFFVVIIRRKWEDFLLMTEVLDSLMTQSMAMISVAARPLQVLVKISLRAVIHWCPICHCKKWAQEKVWKSNSAVSLKCGLWEMDI